MSFPEDKNIRKICGKAIGIFKNIIWKNIVEMKQGELQKVLDILGGKLGN